jgi:hypothetical protein
VPIESTLYGRAVAQANAETLAKASPEAAALEKAQELAARERKAKRASFQTKLLGLVHCDKTGPTTEPFTPGAAVRLEISKSIRVALFETGVNVHQRRMLLGMMAEDKELLAVFAEKTTDLAGVVTEKHFAVSPHYIWPNKSVCGPSAPQQSHESVFQTMRKANTYTKPREVSLTGRRPTRHRRQAAFEVLRDPDFYVADDDCADVESSDDWEAYDYTK